MSEMTSFLDTSCMTTFCARLAATIRDSSSGPSAVLLDVPEICVVGEGRGSCEFQLARLSWSRVGLLIGFCLGVLPPASLSGQACMCVMGALMCCLLVTSI